MGVFFYRVLSEERRQRELLYKAERKKQRQLMEAADKKAKDEFKQQKELRSYACVLYPCFRVCDLRMLNWNSQL